MKPEESVTVTVNPFQCQNVKTCCNLQSQPPSSLLPKDLMTTDGEDDSMEVDDDDAAMAKDIDKESDDTDDSNSGRISTINLSDCSSASSSTSSTRLSATKSKSIEMITITDNCEEHDNENYPTDNNLFETSILSSTPSLMLPLVCDPFSGANTIDDCFRQIAAASVAISKLQPKFRCPKCRLKFVDYSQLVTHLQLDHDNQDLYACLICNTKMTYLASLQKHVKKMHGIIWKNYIRSYGSKTQAKSPKGASYNYQCDQCEKTFSCYRSVKVHKHYSHNPLMNQEATCAICDKHLKNVVSLRIHVARVHKLKFAIYQKNNP